MKLDANNINPKGLLELKEVGISINGNQLFEKLNIEIPEGSIVTVMGPSGCGKSSLLSLICGTISTDFSTYGQIQLGGKTLLDQPPEKRNIGILFQDDLLFPHMSVGENLSFGIPSAMTGRSKRQNIVQEALSEAGLTGMENKDPNTLSGGQKGRVAVMRTLLSQPNALLLDEPFSKLDLELRSRFRSFVFGHVRKNRLPTLLVTHDPNDAEAAGGPIIQLV
tara:strand:- start:324 stop:989 length:666 start_codon:yes stop_codon:yes gene_type:complete